MADERQEQPQEVFNASGEVAKNIIYFFRNCTIAMQRNDLITWWQNLDSAYLEAAFSIKEKDKKELEKLWKLINPYKKDSYPLLKEYHIRLRDLCKHFFTMGDKSNPGTAVYR